MNIDRLTEQIRNETVDGGVVEAAGERVAKTLFGAGAAGVERIRGCEDFQALIPAYLQKTLSDARRMLLEAHTRECVGCRKAMERARGGEKLRPMPVRGAGTTRMRQWAIAAALVLGVGLAGAVAARYVGPGMMGGPRATVTTVNGMLYRVSNHGSLPVGEGQELGEGEEIRTGRGTTAVVTLFDGSRVEMNERADLSVTRGWRGTTIRLDRGHIIVQAAKQKQGRLYVTTGDAQVAVKGTIFSVNRGTMGSRVAVVEGEVEVEHGGRTESLKPGAQTATNPAIAPNAVEKEIAWSKDSARYLALLGEFHALQQSFAAIPGTGLRYSSRLLVYMPEDAYLFAAIPNMKVTLAEGKRLFDERVTQSEVLKEWWNAPGNAKMRAELEVLIQTLQDLSGMVGEEVVLTVGGDGKNPAPLLMAEAKNPAVGAALETLFKQTHGGGMKFAYGIQNNVLLVATDAGRLQAAKALVSRGGGTETAFRQRIRQAYESGAGTLVCANMEQILKQSVNSKVKQAPAELGFDNVQFLVLERREVANKTENRAAVSFAGERHGLAAWLAAPGPLSTLDFVSPDAGMAFAMVVKSPRTLVEEVFRIARQANGNFDGQLMEAEQVLGVKVIDDLAAPLGSEMTFAQDGPMLPVPSWKVAVEVNAPQRLQASIERLLEGLKNVPNAKPVKLTAETVNGQVFYSITSDASPIDVHYAYVDSYLVAAANRTLLTQAIQNRQTGFTLPRSDRFRAQLPYAATPNFSGVFYHDMGRMLGPAVDALKNSTTVTGIDKEAMLALKDTAPGLIAAYGEPDRIVLATNGTFLGFNLGMLTGFHKGMPLYSPKLMLEQKKQR